MYTDSCRREHTANYQIVSSMVTTHNCSKKHRFKLSWFPTIIISTVPAPLTARCSGWSTEAFSAVFPYLLSIPLSLRGTESGTGDWRGTKRLRSDLR
jgi:hypothetical protein